MTRNGPDLLAARVWPRSPQGAPGIQIYAPTLIPGPLQVYGYREAVHAYPLACECGHDESEMPRGIPVTIVLEESALRHRVGGNDVMAAQLDHVLGFFAGESDVSVSVIPLHAARTTRQLPRKPFVIINRREVVLPIAPVPVLLGDHDYVSRYSRRFDHLRQVAITGTTAYEYVARLLPPSTPDPLDDALEGKDLTCAVTA